MFTDGLGIVGIGPEKRCFQPFRADARSTVGLRQESGTCPAAGPSGHAPALPAGHGSPCERTCLEQAPSRAVRQTAEEQYGRCPLAGPGAPHPMRDDRRSGDEAGQTLRHSRERDVAGRRHGLAQAGHADSPTRSIIALRGPPAGYGIVAPQDPLPAHRPAEAGAGGKSRGWWGIGRPPDGEARH